MLMCVNARNPADLEQRAVFITFLERFAEGEADGEQWMRLVVNHYLDQTLERIRRECVRLRMQNETMRWSPEEHSRIRDWIRELGTATE